VLLNDFRTQWADVGHDVQAAFTRVGESGWYILGTEVRAFESSAAELFGTAAAIGCASGLDAIEIGLRAMGLAPGDRVLTTPLSAFATTLAIVRAGGIPEFVDVDPRGQLDLDRCADVLQHHPEIRFFVPVHLYGHALDLGALAALAARFGVRILEDCAQAIGARWEDRPVGSVGLASATSFYPTKNLGAMGDGGAVVTSDLEVASFCRSLRDYGQSERYRHERLGLNSRLDELHAAILSSAFLPRLKAWTERRRAIAAEYRANLRHPAVTVPELDARSQSVWHLFPVLVEAPYREAFRRHLGAQGIDTGVHYPILIPAQQALAGVPYRVHGELTQAARYAAGEVSLPIHPYLDRTAIDRVVVAVNGWVP